MQLKFIFSKQIQDIFFFTCYCFRKIEYRIVKTSELLNSSFLEKQEYWIILTFAFSEFNNEITFDPFRQGVLRSSLMSDRAIFQYYLSANQLADVKKVFISLLQRGSSSLIGLLRELNEVLYVRYLVKCLWHSEHYINGSCCYCCLYVFSKYFCALINLYVIY